MRRLVHRHTLAAACAIVAIAVIAWFAVRAIRSRGPYRVEDKELSGWTLVEGEPGDTAVVALRPPMPLAAELFQQILGRRGPTLVAPAHPSVPLVLQSEYSDSLQGVFSVEDIMDLARDAGVTDARFQPVCMGRRQTAAQELFYVVFAATAFTDFRDHLTPLFPEHGGAVPYDPGALRPILTVAATDAEFTRWWPIPFDEHQDCQAALQVH